MKAAILNSPQDVLKRPLQIVDVPRPELVAGHVLLRVRACGVCRTDLHIVEGELRPRRRTSFRAIKSWVTSLMGQRRSFRLELA